MPAIAPAESLAWPEDDELELLGAAWVGVMDPRGEAISTEGEEEDDGDNMDEIITVVGGIVEAKADVMS